MSKTIEEVIEEMIDEQTKDGETAIIHLDEPTLNRVEEETGYLATIKKLGKAVQKFALEMGYGLYYDDNYGKNNFVITPSGKDV